MHRINYCAGDWLFGLPMRKTYDSRISFRGRIIELPAMYHDVFSQQQIDTVVLFGDCRPIHIPAVRAALARGIEVYVFEEGYIRPGWVTMEVGGTNRLSRMPRTPEGVMALAASLNCKLADEATLTPVETDLWRRSWMDIANHAANILGSAFYRRYRGHRPQPAIEELIGWARKLTRKRLNRGRNRATLHRYQFGDEPFFLVPLQLNADFQIRVHSPFSGMPEFIEKTLESFAANAPKHMRLFFKNHPLDNGLINYRRMITERAAFYGLGDRVDFASGGDLDVILARAQGVVLVNSTVGFAALKTGRPVKVLGNAIYDIPKLADQKTLDQFWQAPMAPEPALAQAFLAVIQTCTQIRGDFFSVQGAEIAMERAVDVIEGRLPRLPRPLSTMP